MNPLATLIILGLAGAWLIQYGLSYWQMRRFYGRIAELRRLGTVSVGMAGSAWKRRQYAVLVVDRQGRIVRAEELSGWTVLANLKPVEGLEGCTLDELADDAVQLPIALNRKLLLALRNAASHIKAAEERAAARCEEAGAETGA